MLVFGINVSSNFYLLTAFGGGVISFLSPCVLPIVPGSSVRLHSAKTSRSNSRYSR